MASNYSPPDPRQQYNAPQGNTVQTQYAHQQNIAAAKKTTLPRSISTTTLDATSRVRSVVQRDWVEKAPRGGTNFFTTLPAFTLTLPTLEAYPRDFQEFVFGLLVDKETQRFLEGEKCLNWCSSVTNLVPLYTTGDGNCLMHAASLSMWGVHDRDYTLRRAVFTALQIRKGTHLHRRWKRNRTLEHDQLGLQLEPHQWDYEWQLAVSHASTHVPQGQSLETLDDFHVFVLANVLRRPIFMYAAPKLRSQATGGTLQQINFHGVYLPLMWDPSSCLKDPLPLAYCGGHFISLVAIEHPSQYYHGVLVLPLTDFFGQQFPVRYTLEMEDHSALLMNYLSLLQIANHDSPYVTSKKVVCARLTIPEVPTYLKPLVAGFIDACIDAHVANQHQQPQQGMPQQYSDQQAQNQKVQVMHATTAPALEENCDKAQRAAKSAENGVETLCEELTERCSSCEQTLIEFSKKSEQTSTRITELDQRLADALQQIDNSNTYARNLETRLAELEQSVSRLQDPQPAQPFWVLSRAEIRITEEEIGRGGWGAIKVAEFRGQRVAAKMLHDQIISPNNLRLFTREMNMSARIHHPNIVQFIGATTEGVPIILAELMSTSLRNELAAHPLPKTQILSIASDVARALNYLHLMQPRPIVHRDVSTANILLDRTIPPTVWKAKLSDFGSTNFVSTMATAGPGNPVYAAPEAFNPYDQSPKMDVFSFGVVLIEAFTREMPSVEERDQLIEEIQWPPIVPLIRRCIQLNREGRPAMVEALTELTSLQQQ